MELKLFERKELRSHIKNLEEKTKSEDSTEVKDPVLDKLRSRRAEIDEEISKIETTPDHEDKKKIIHLKDKEESEMYRLAEIASIIGDTVGDPLKDTSGPSLNILIKLSSIISLVFGSLFVKTSWIHI